MKKYLGACFIHLPLSMTHGHLSFTDYAFINVEQIEVVRKGTRHEKLGRGHEITTIILQNDVHVYVKGYITSIMEKVRGCKT